jgi:hypothetical protein
VTSRRAPSTALARRPKHFVKGDGGDGGEQVSPGGVVPAPVKTPVLFESAPKVRDG